MRPELEGNRQASFSFRNKIGRAVWDACWLLLFRPSPRPFHSWRSLLLRCFGACVGKSVHVYPAVRIWAPWNLELGDHVGIGDGAILYCQAKITIGAHAVISQGAHVCTGTHDYSDPSFPLRAIPICIGAHAWVAAEAFIHPGVTIGEGTVLGARSVATTNLAPWTVYAGHPAGFIKARNMKPDNSGL